MVNGHFKIYRFSPIDSQEKLLEAIQYVAENMTVLGKKVTGLEYPIACLTIFSHYADEYEFLKKTILNMGKFYSEANGLYVKLNEPIKFRNSHIELLRVRNPDPYRLHVGCGDLKVLDFESFKKEYLKAKPENLRIFNRLDYDMIEIFDPDFDVLAYIMSKDI